MKVGRIICVMLVLCFCFASLCGCSANENAVTVNSVSVSKEIYGYYLSVAENSHRYKKEQDKQAVAKRLCAEYVAGNELIKKNSVKLSAEDKVVVSSEVKANWQLYSGFYKKYSVSKQALCEILEYESLINALVEKLYSPGGERALSEDEVKAFFAARYIAARVVYTPFTPDMTKKEIDSITSKLQSMAGVIRAGSDFPTAIEQYPDLVEYEDVDHIISAFDSSYPEGFFEKVVKVPNNNVQVLRFSDGVYLIKKTDASGFFNVYKSQCIVKMKKEQVLNEIAEKASGYRVRVNSAAVKEVLRKADDKN